ncbi:MAG TPA: SPASM domain-containing protein [Saprospiraceae bacterium]|nr:SPASM domain-containing protein [Saprospiraceae bacterium]HMP12307.1 SPASM domain-containing protein [Saprospiraceae bacterium]
MANLHLHDSFNFLRKLTPRRLYNASKVLLSYYLSKWLKRPVQWGLPFTISVEPTTACNLRCPECPSGLRAFTRPTGNLKADFFRRMLAELHRDLLFLIFYFQGEPYINPDFLEMVAHAHQQGIYTITSTNGHFLSMENARRTVTSGLDRLIISVDGATQEVYEQYRKSGKLEVVLQGARNVVACKRALGSRTPHIIFQVLVVRPNEHQIPDIFRLAQEIGVDEVKLKTAQVYDYEQGNPLIPLNPRYARYALHADGTYRIKNKLLNHCWKLWHACVITWDGVVVPCCFDKDASHRLGSLQENTFRAIWHGKKYQAFRKQLLGGRKNINICTNCTEGCKVWAE